MQGYSRYSNEDDDDVFSYDYKGNRVSMMVDPQMPTYSLKLKIQINPKSNFSQFPAPVEGDDDSGPSLLSLGQECEDWPVQRVINHYYMDHHNFDR